MAKKSRTPPPPRTVQAPKARGGERSRPSLGGNSRAIVIAIAVVLVVVGGSRGWLPRIREEQQHQQRHSDTSQLAAAMAAAGCTLHTYPSAGAGGHITTLNPNPPIKYNSFPPTSGKHYYVPAVWGSYDAPVSEYQAIHNLEHGGIVIQYGKGVSEDTVSQVGDFYQSDPVALLVAPLPKLGNKVALTAWTHLALCPGFDEKAFKAFRDAYRYQGPEKFPPNALQPGM